MARSKEAGKPFYVYLPYTQVHNPPIPDPQYAGKTKRGNWADILTQMDDFTGMILDKLEELGHRRRHDRRLGLRQRRRHHLPLPRDRPGPGGRSMARVLRAVAGRVVHRAGGVEPDACIVRWPGKVPAGRVSNELVHAGRLVHDAAERRRWTVPGDRMIDGMDMRDFLLGDAEESGRDIILCLQGNRLQAAKWHQWKVHLFKQDDFYSTWSPQNMPSLYNLEWDPREEHQVDFPHAWVLHPVAAAAGAFLKSLVAEPPIKPGTPDPYTPPKPGELRPRHTCRSARSSQYITTLVQVARRAPDPGHGIEHQAG